jgi:uncharacterized lipoprotein NlpE involved in copper resistance
MNKMLLEKSLSLFFACAFFQISCNSGSEKVSDHVENSSAQQESQLKNFSGKFSGVTPCADCPGIETTVVFKHDSVFTETLNYLERNVSFSDTGKWSVGDKIITVTFPGKSIERYFLIKSDSTLSMLDADQKEIDGNLADTYILKRKE